MTPIQKCPHCHTPLPDFRPLEPKICPNCNKRVKYEQSDDGSISDKLIRWIKKNPFVFWPFLFYAAVCLITGEFEDSIIGYIILMVISLLTYAGAQRKKARQEQYAIPKKEPEARPTLRPTPGKHKAVGPVLNTPLLVFFCALTAVSVVFMLIGIGQQQRLEQAKDRLTEVNARILSIESTDDEEYDVYVSYTYAGTTYEDVLLPYYDSSMEEGDMISVTIDPENPDLVLSDTPIFIILSGIFLAIGLIGLYFSVVVPLRKAKSKQRVYL